MNKIIVAIISILVILLAIFFGTTMYKNDEQGKVTNQVDNVTELSEQIVDECTEEFEEMQKANEIDTQANSQEEIKLSPNCSFTFKTHYQGCGHISNQYINIPKQLVNKTQAEVDELYSDWNIEKFQNNEVILSKTENGECGEHYVIRDVNGQIVIYIIDNNGEEKEYEKTEIATEYLTETDKITIKNGLKVYGKEALNQVIEDFE